MQIEIRLMSENDAEPVNRLTHQLGYTLSLEETLRNITSVLNSRDHAAFVAVYENQIIGWIGAAHSIMIEVMPHCEINGLVIDDNYQGKGVGRRLIQKVREWGRAQGLNKLSLRCNIKRTEAHKFYEHLGFKELKQQKNFVIDI